MYLGLDAIAEEMPIKSNKPIIEMRLVSFRVPVKLLTSTGIIRFKTCGSIMSIIVFGLLRLSDMAASYCVRGIPWNPPRKFSAIYAEWKAMMPIIALINTLGLSEEGRASGMMRYPMKSIVIRGTPRTISMNAVHIAFISLRLDRRPIARRRPIGKEKRIEVREMIMERSRPPQ